MSMDLPEIPRVGVVTVAPIEIDIEPQVAFHLLANAPHSFFLDTALPDCYGLGHHSFMGARPFVALRTRDENIELITAKDVHKSKGNPFDALAALVNRFDVSGDVAALPFTGGMVGYFSYDLGRFIERLPRTVEDGQKFPELYVAFYRKVLAHDHRTGRWYMCVTNFEGLPELDPEKEATKTARRFEALLEDPPPEPSEPPPAEMESNFSREEYLQAVERVLEYIRAGDIYQVNLSQRFRTDRIEKPLQTYMRLRKRNAAPFAAYLGFKDIQVLSSSPERFLRVRGRSVETRPIKGTRPRGKTDEEDRRFRDELLASVKDRAELNMIVDLERNDLGKVCEYGSVEVTRHAAIESYATVHHLVSTVEGTLKPDVGIVDIIKATSPGGSITGAPKIRAMEIIDELEPTARSLYTGSIGYIRFDGDADLNIAIRIVLAGPKKLTFQVGGGIVADSDPEAEFEETLHKGRAIFSTLGSEEK